MCESFSWDFFLSKILESKSDSFYQNLSEMVPKELYMKGNLDPLFLMIQIWEELILLKKETLLRKWEIARIEDCEDRQYLEVGFQGVFWEDCRLLFVRFLMFMEL